MMGMLFSCENDLEVINTVTATDDTPTEVMKSFHTLYSDSGVVSREIIATQMERYDVPIRKTIFKDGFEVNFFGEKDSIVSKLTADYAEISEAENTIVVRNNVIFTNYKQKQTLETEELFWDKVTKQVRTDKQFKVIGESSTVTGYGLETDETFTNYEMHKVKGTYTNKDTVQ